MFHGYLEIFYHALIMSNQARVEGWGLRSFAPTSNNLKSKNKGVCVKIWGLIPIIFVLKGYFYSFL